MSVFKKFRVMGAIAVLGLTSCGTGVEDKVSTEIDKSETCQRLSGAIDTNLDTCNAYDVTDAQRNACAITEDVLCQKSAQAGCHKTACEKREWKNWESPSTPSTPAPQ